MFARLLMGPGGPWGQILFKAVPWQSGKPPESQFPEFEPFGASGALDPPDVPRQAQILSPPGLGKFKQISIILTAEGDRIVAQDL